MLIGDRQYISREVQLEFQRSGTYHLLVVSGMNIAILAFALFWVLRRIGAGPEVATPLTILVSCGYAALTDSGAPVMRALLMFCVYQITRLLYRERAALNAVRMAALILLVWKPARAIRSELSVDVSGRGFDRRLGCSDFPAHFGSVSAGAARAAGGGHGLGAVAEDGAVSSRAAHDCHSSV